VACLTVDPAPTVSSLVPNNGPQASTMDVDVYGSGFDNGPKVAFGKCCLTGITVNSIQWIDSTHLTLNITIVPNAATGSRDVTVTNPDGSKATCKGCFTVGNPGWLGFVTNRDGNYELYKTTVLGGSPTDLSNDPADNNDGFNGYSWSADGTQIAFERGSPGGQGIYVMNSDGSGQHFLVAGGGPVWSPAGTKIAYDCGGDVCDINVDGTGQTNLTNRDQDPDFPAFADPAWSPDGTRLALDEIHGSGSAPWDVLAVNADGSNLTNLTNDPACDEINPEWSPDGARILYEHVCTLATSGIGDLAVMNADGSSQTVLTSDAEANTFPQWSPDGTKIAYTSATKKGTAISTINADGTGRTRLPGTSGVQGALWSPDGTKLAFDTERTGKFCLQANREIIVMNADGSNAKDITNNCADDVAPSWQPG
jgi:TolB protein